MRDGSFLTLLRDVVSVRRPQVDVSPLGTPRTPRYVLVAEDVPCALQPATAGRGDTVVGKVGLATHVAYLEPTDVRDGDLLVERVVRYELADSVPAGSAEFRVVDDAGLVEGLRVEVGVGLQSELHLVLGGSGCEVTVAGQTVAEHEAGEPVYAVVAYEVCGVRDEAGQGHHVRLELRTPGN